MQNGTIKWSDELIYAQQMKSWEELHGILEESLLKDPNNAWKYVEVIYFLLDILLYGNCKSMSDHDKIAEILKEFFERSYKKFSENAEYLFFVGYFMALAVWYFGQDNLNLSHKMLKKATEIEPQNKLFEWAYKFSTNHSSTKEVVKQLLLDSKNMKWLKSKGQAGEYMIDAINNYIAQNSPG